MSTATRTRRFSFAVFEADPGTGELLRQGARVKLQEQPFRLLIVLLERAGEVVSREDLRTRLWPQDTFVAFDNSLNVAVRKLREALRDDAETPRFVETVPRRGYRFIAPVTIQGEIERRDPARNPVPDGPILPAPTASTKRWYIWPLLAIAVVVMIAVLWVRLRKPAIVLTGKDTVVLADFVNTTGESVFDDALKQGLQVGLQQSPVLNVLSDRKIDAILKEMGRSPDERLTGKIVLELCQRANSKVAVQGSVASLGNSYLIGLAAIRCDNGDPIANEQVQARHKEQVVDALGQAAARLRAQLGESIASIQKYDVPLEQATTPSLDALKAYNQGLAIWDKQGDQASLSQLTRAVEIDPNFAMGYAALSTIYHNLGESGLSSENMTKAYRLSDRLADFEKLSIQSRYYAYVTGELYKAAEINKLRLQRGQNLPGTLTNLGGIYTALGKYDDAIAVMNQAIQIEPGRAAVYADLAKVQMAINRPRDAAATLVEAAKRNLQSDYIPQVNYLLAFLSGDKGAMEREIPQSRNMPGAESLLTATEAGTEAFYGHIKKAHELSRQAADMMVQEGDKESAALALAESAVREAEIGDAPLAQTSAEQALATSRGPGVKTLVALASALNGDVKHAESPAAELNSAQPAGTLLQGYWLPVIRAQIFLRQQKPDRALETLASSIALESGSPSDFSAAAMFPAYVRGEAYLMAGDGTHAGQEFQKLIDNPGLVLNSPLGSLARLGRGRAYARFGDLQAARTSYQEFFKLWQDAEPDLRIIQQAQREYEHLKLTP